MVPVTSGLIVRIILSGLFISGTYAMLSIGLTLIVGVLRIINFAHGALLMVAMYVTYWLFSLFHIDPFLLLILTVPLFFVIGAGIQKVLISPLKSHENQVLVTFMFAILLQSLAIFFWSADYRTLLTPYTGIHFRFLNTGISFLRLLMVVVALLLAGFLHFFVTRTKIGKAIWALAQDPEVAMLMGINIRRLQWFTFGIGTAILGISGTFLAQLMYVFPAVGMNFLIIAFVVVVLGGFGSIGGALLGSFIIGFVVVLSTIFIGAGYADLIVFLIFVLILVFKPSGIFGKIGL